MNTYEASDPTGTAKRMLELYKSSYAYTAYDRALDHAQSYESATYQYRFWMQVGAEILRLQRENLSRKVDAARNSV